MTRNENAAALAQGRAAPQLTLGWALKRAMLGFLILFVMFGGGAWLLYSTIEPDRADASEVTQYQTTTPGRPAGSR